MRPGADVWLQLGAALIARTALPRLDILSWLDRGAVQFAVAGLMAFETIYSEATSATSCAKRSRRKGGSPFADSLGLISLRGAQRLLVTWLPADMSWDFFALHGVLLSGFLLMKNAPLHLRQPAGAPLLTSSLVQELTTLPSPKRVVWFVPLFFVKPCAGRLSVEALLRPAWETSE